MKKTPPILLISALLIPVVLLTGLTTNGQKAYPIDLLTLLGQIPMPDNSSRCYAGSATTTDSSNGLVSIANTDPTFKQFSDQLDNIMKTAVGAAYAQTHSPTQPPTPEQIEQMKQQALQTAAAYQNKTPQVAILGASMSTWEDAAKIYASWVNAKSGSSVGCFNR